MNNLAERALRALIVGIVTFGFVALVLFIITLVVETATIQIGLWAGVVGVLAGLYVFVSGRSIV